MTAITATSPVITQSSLAVPAATTTAVSGTSASAPASPAQSPAVVISLSPGTLSALSHPADTTAEQRVNSLVEDVKTHNDIANLHAHVDWASYAKYVGAEKANSIKKAGEEYLQYSSTRIGRELGESGVDVRPATDQQVAATGVAPGTLLVKDFAFQAGGSTYAVTVREDGTLVGTRDGQAWKTWKTVPAQTAASGTSAPRRPWPPCRGCSRRVRRRGRGHCSTAAPERTGRRIRWPLRPGRRPMPDLRRPPDHVHANYAA